MCRWKIVTGDYRMRASAKWSERASTKILLFLALGLTFSQFWGGVRSWNSISGFGLTLNLVQQSRIDIDGYDVFTGDKSFYNGKYYSDKAPGMSFLAMPIAFAYTRIFEITPDSKRHFSIMMYLCIMTT